jgi:predicted transcriptional regulator
VASSAFAVALPAVRFASRSAAGYTFSMRTAVSVPDDVFRKAERLARRTRKSRNQVLSEALREYVARHAPDEITEAMNRVVAATGERADEFAAAASRRALERTEG